MEESNTSYQMDRSIVLFFVFAILITASVFAYRYMHYTPCEAVDFKINAKQYRVGEIIRFKDKTKGNIVKRIWNFGDQSNVDKRLNPYHIYEYPGQYIVKLEVNNRCIGTETITIKEKVFVPDPRKLAKFTIPNTINVGEVLKPIESTPSGQEWEWRFGETVGVDSKTKNPEYSYRTPGLKTVVLVVNGDVKHSTKKRIRVLPVIREYGNVPDPYVRNGGDGTNSGVPIDMEPTITNTRDSEPEKKKVKDIANNVFTLRLYAIAAERGSAEDLDEYLCGNLNLNIIVNKKPTTFLEFCERIKGKPLFVRKLNLIKDDNNCIKNITIRCRGLGFLSGLLNL